MKIFLIGMPGSGKSTLGKQVAAELQLTFIDLDHEIEKRENKSIPEIFNQLGEDYFRQLESQVLHEWAGSDNSFVMATGGGAPCFLKGIDVINETGISVFLDVSVDFLMKRLEDKTDRPLLQVSDSAQLKNRLEALRQSRLACYEKAKFILQDPTTSTLLQKINLKM